MNEIKSDSNPKRAVVQSYGLSPMQSGMLFQALLDNPCSALAKYDVEQIHLLFEEKLDVAALKLAWNFIVERHSILATSFQWDEVDEPQQIVNHDLVVPFDFDSGKKVNDADYNGQLEAYLRQDRCRGFDLRVAPLMRVKVFGFSDTRTDLIWTFHHILLDGRSFAPLLREIFMAYDAFRDGHIPQLAPTPRPYADFVGWIGRLERQRSQQFFRALLEGKMAPTPLPGADPLTRPLPAVCYGETIHYVSDAVVQLARRVAERTDTTIGTLMQAAWALVLTRYTGDKDVVFGATRACRHSALNGEAESMIGLFINTLPVRARLAADCTVAELLKDLRRQSLAMRSHEHNSLIEIHRQAEFGAGIPLFETLVMFESQGLCQHLLESGEPHWAQCQLTLHEQPSLPLNLTIYDGRKFEVRALFDCRRFQPIAVERLLAAFNRAIEELSGDEHRRISDLDVLPSDETQRILIEWNGTARSFPDQQCIHEPFEAQVARTPDALAVEMNGVGLTYRALEERANRLAHALRARGARPGVYVGICLSRGLDLVVTLMGVAKSGAAYVPLDSQYPRERLAFMLSDAHALFVVTEERHRALFDAPMLVLDAEGDAELAAMSTERPGRWAVAQDVCYAIFTSGSTGVPKGVVLSHRAVVNTFDWVTRTFELGTGDRLLFVTSPCFDLSVYDTFGVLGAGGTVVVASDEMLRDPAALAITIVDQQITVWDSAPAALQRLVPFFPESSKSAPLRLVLLSGDWIPVTLPDAMRAAFPKAKVMSLGGATEAAIWSNWFPIGDVDPRWSSIPYGKPIQNSRYHVLDEQLRPVPIGVAGDLYIGGTCLANGYLNREELTRERFIPDPFRSGERLYKTGDLARYFDDGNLEFQGRADFQVKIRGFRVEMGEVEAVLCGLAEVREAVCSAHGDASGQKSLIAYVVPENGVVLNEDSLKASLAEKLPDFMVPSQVMQLSAMPLSQNGKLDRKALPAPGTRANTDVFVAPRSELEQRMATLWEDVLQRKPIGIQEDFFKLGGHSLLAVLLISRIKTQLGMEVPLSRMMERSTIESLVQSLEETRTSPKKPSHLVALRETGSRPPIFFFPGAGGYSFIFRDLPVQLGEDQPAYSFQAIGADQGPGNADLSIEEMGVIYVGEILEARPNGPYVLAGYSFGILVAFEVARQIRKLGHRVSLLISLDGFAPGFPRLMPLAERLVYHLKAFLKPDERGRAQYLQGRILNIKRRVFERLGRADELIEDIPFANEEMNQRMRKLWAHFWRARLRYHPTDVEPCNLLLIKSEVPEAWVGCNMNDPLYGWNQFIRGGISTVTIPGEHLRLFEGTSQVLIANAIAKHITLYSNRST